MFLKSNYSLAKEIGQFIDCSPGVVMDALNGLLDEGFIEIGQGKTGFYYRLCN